jgi:predicted permease
MWGFLRKRISDGEIDEELSAHLAIEVKQLMDGGMGREEAEREARRRLGNRGVAMETAREVRGFAGVERLWQDAGYAFRILRRTPAFTGAAVLSLALGIAAATAVLSIADTVFLRPLPYKDSQQLAWVGIQFRMVNGPLEFVPSPDYIAWRRDNRVFQNLAAVQPNMGGTIYLSGPEPAEATVVRVSANFLDTLAVAPAMGRNFRPEEEAPNGAAAAILTDAFWRTRFHARRDTVGKVVSLDGQSVTIVGVLPPSFAFPADEKIDLLMPLTVNPAASHHDRMMSMWAVIGRMKPGVTITQARANVRQLLTATSADLQELFRDHPVVVKPLQGHRAGEVRTLVLILIAAAGCLLAIACANVANLLLARWAARGRELAVRAAIGASRGRMARQLFAEIALLVTLGGAAAMALTAVALRGFAHFAGGELPRLNEAQADYRVFGLAVLICLATALVFGGLPLARAGRVDLLAALQQVGRGATAGGRQWLRRALIAVEVALSVVLLSGAALLMQTLWHMRNDHLGFLPEHLLTVDVPVRGPREDKAAREALAADVAGYLRRTPGAQAVSRSECTPVSGGSGIGAFSRSDRPMPSRFNLRNDVVLCRTDDEYAKATGMRVLRGRYFNQEDLAHPDTTAVINEATARQYFPGENPLGVEIMGTQGIWRKVVGVIADSKNQGLKESPLPEAFFNNLVESPMPDLRFLVRTLADEDSVAQELRTALRREHPGQFVKVQSLNSEMGEMSAGPRFNMILISGFAAIALVMAIVGVYGVLAFSVAQRRQEIGIRMALGAAPGAVLANVMGESAVLVTAGAAAGLAASLALNRYLASLLYGVKPGDVWTYAAVVAGLALAAGVASLGPARRAAGVDPAVALREE